MRDRPAPINRLMCESVPEPFQPTQRKRIFHLLFIAISFDGCDSAFSLSPALGFRREDYATDFQLRVFLLSDSARCPFRGVDTGGLVPMTVNNHWNSVFPSMRECVWEEKEGFLVECGHPVHEARPSPTRYFCSPRLIGAWK